MHIAFHKQKGSLLILMGRAIINPSREPSTVLADSSANPRVIFIKKGTYNEKIYIQKHNIVLEGEDRDKTIITQDIARDEWRCDHKDDWGVATLNLDGNDITLKNLTIANDYGFNHKEPRTVVCASDTDKPSKGDHQQWSPDGFEKL